MFIADSRKRYAMAAEYYEEITRVTVRHDGLPVHLLLQKRFEFAPEPFHCLSWRTRYPSDTTKSRRFNRLKETGFWTIPVRVASCLMRQARDRGMLDPQYDDPFWGAQNPIIDSRTLDVRGRLSVFDTIICDKGEPDWGDNPVFVISECLDGTWRKIMLVDTRREICTFRSTTTSVDYKPIIVDPHRSPWRMDNSMQDASAAMMRKFLSVMEEI